jgi:hypothetical protein
MESVVAVFTSEREAKEQLLAIAKEHRLCHKFMGLEKTSSACFAYHLNSCGGACIGQESPLAYQLRFDQAFAKLKLHGWPYAGPILVTEHGLDRQDTSFVVDQWRIVATIQRHDQEVSTTHYESSFDLDQYKILRRFLSAPHSGTTITVMQPSDLAALELAIS